VVIPLHDNNATQRVPVVTFAIIAICIAVFVFVQDRGSPEEEAIFYYENAAIPCEIREGEPLDAADLQDGECGGESFGEQIFPEKSVWLSILSSMFLHGSWLHLLGNLWFLWIFGNNVEDYLGKIGFILFYLVSGVAATAAHFLVDPGSTVPVIGASGAIAGVMGMYLVLWPRARVISFVPFFFIFLLPLPAFLVLAGWFVLQFFTGENTDVAWVAHVGGFVFGAVVGWLLKRVKKPHEVDFVGGRRSPEEFTAD
jgi:membrane associated rhomboid family serine protease